MSEEIKVLLKLQAIAFMDGQGFALQSYVDQELKLSKSVRIPHKKGEYREPQITWHFRGEAYTDPLLINAALLADEESRPILEQRYKEERKEG